MKGKCGLNEITNNYSGLQCHPPKSQQNETGSLDLIDSLIFCLDTNRKDEVLMEWVLDLCAAQMSRRNKFPTSYFADADLSRPTEARRMLHGVRELIFSLTLKRLPAASPKLLLLMYFGAALLWNGLGTQDWVLTVVLH